MTTRLFFSSFDFSEHAEHISASQGDARYVNEDGLAPKGAQHFLTKPVADHLDMRAHRLTHLAHAAKDSDAATLRQVRMLRRVKWGRLSSPDGIKLFLLSKCTSCVSLSLLVSRAVYSARLPSVYFVSQQMPAHVVQLGEVVVFFPYSKNEAKDAPYRNAAYTLTFMADADYAERKISTANMAGLHAIANGVWDQKRFSKFDLIAAMADDRWDDFLLNWGPLPDANARPPLGAYYGLESPLTLPITEDLDMSHHKLVNLSPAAAPGDAVTLQQLPAAETRIGELETEPAATRALRLKTTSSTIERNSHGLAIVHEGPNCTPLSLLIRPLGQSAYSQEPFVLLGNFVLFSTRNALLNSAPYRFHYVGTNCEPITQEQRNRSELALAASTTLKAFSV